MTNDYVEISPHGGLENISTRPPFRFTIDGDKFELPALDSASVPLPLLPVFLAVAGGHVEHDEDRIRIAGSFIGFIQDEYPPLWRALKRQREPLRWIIGLIEQWAAHSGLDPQQPPSGR